MLKQATQNTSIPAGVAVVLASSAWLVPAALSASSAPTPNHPRVFLWYQSLRMPFFKPPDWVIPLAWFGIEGGLAAAGYRLLRSPPNEERLGALTLLSWNTFMIGAWSRLFFRHRNLAASTLAAATMIGTGAALVRQASKIDPVASRASVPFVAWVSFATVLTATIWGLNRRHR